LPVSWPVRPSSGRKDKKTGVETETAMMDGWPRNAWYAAMYGHDLPAGQLVARTILGEGIALFRDAAGQACALEDACPHRNAPLSAGRVLDGGRVMCGYHGLEFDTAGTCVRNPHGSGRIPAAAAVRSYPVCEQFGVIWVWMGDRPADPTTLFDLGAFAPDSGYVVGKPDWLLMEAPCDLIVDNLLDLSHVSFLHDGVLGNAETIAAQTTLKQDGQAITVERFMAGVAPPEYFNLLYRGDDRPVDMWHSIRWEPPASLFLDVGCTAAGASRDAGTGVFAAHLLTPRTATTTMYHFLGARYNPLPRDEADNARIQARLAELRRLAFAGQDEPMIRAQHAVISARGGKMQTVALEIDAGVIRWRRIMDGLLAAA
jgi:vanillate O-demethylase monooxygenase subunit